MERPPRKRRRPALSCAPCRQRKVKCNREEPCDQCTKTTTVTVCYYDGDGGIPRPAVTNPPPMPNGGSRPTSFPSSAPSTMPSGAARADASNSSEARDLQGTADPMSITSLNGIIPRINMDHSPDRSHQKRAVHTDCHHECASSRQLAALRSLVEDLGRRVQKLESSPEGIKETNPAVPPPKLRLRTGPDKNKFWGPTHYIHSYPQNDVYPRLKAKMTRSYAREMHSSGVVALIEQCRSLRKRVQATESMQSFDPSGEIPTLPPREVSNQLVENYLRTFEPLYRIVNVPHFRRDYERYWSEAGAVTSASARVITLALAVGSVFHQPEQAYHALRPSVLQWVYAAQWWLDGPTEKTTMTFQGLQVRALLVLARQALSIGPVESAWIAAGSLLQHAMALGLHKDPKHFADLSHCDVEMRRRLWATTCEMALLTSLAANQPPPLFTAEIDCRPPGNFDDLDLGNNVDLDPQQNPEGVHTDTSLQRLLCESFPQRSDALRRLHQGDLSHDKAQELHAVMTLAQTKLCDCVADQLESNGTNRVLLPTAFNSRLARVSFAEYMLLLQRPFVLNTDEPSEESTTKALDAAMAMLGEVGNFDESLMPLEDFDMLTIRGGGALKSAVSMDAIAVLCGKYDVFLEYTDDAAHCALKRLGGVCRQLEHLISRGNPSMKRYIFLSAMFGQITARREGKAADTGLLDGRVRALETCKRLLTAYLGETPASYEQDDAYPAFGGVNGILDPPMFDLNESELDPWLLGLWNDIGLLS